VAACSHDVGHNGLANRFHVTATTPLARLYNDQSPLENMHCAITFAVLQASTSNFLISLEAHQRATFRGCVTQMILDTDLGKHIQTLSRFRQEFLHNQRDNSQPHTPSQRKELLAFALKCCDVAHSTKPFDLHVLWTLRINAEFFQQGDTERILGLPCSPFCDREATHVAESQRGFYDFIVSPLYYAMDEHLGSRRLQMEVLPQMEKNRDFWKMYDGSEFDYQEPVSNAEKLRGLFHNWNMRYQGAKMGGKVRQIRSSSEDSGGHSEGEGPMRSTSCQSQRLLGALQAGPTLTTRIKTMSALQDMPSGTTPSGSTPVSGTAPSSTTAASKAPSSAAAVASSTGPTLTGVVPAPAQGGAAG